MDTIQMVDLKKQYFSIKKEIDIAILSVLETTQFINGPIVHSFSKQLADYLQVPFVVPCANGTDALQLAIMALDLQQGDEVILPSFTYIATAEVIALLKLIPVFVDVDPISFCIDPIAIEKAITSRTKAIVPVHLFGQSANMESIMHIANKYHIVVIEDNAQSLGADFFYPNNQSAKTGTIGTIGCTSFFPSKNLGCYGDGGALFTKDAMIYEKLNMLANHGQSKRYYHDIVGCNSRLDSIQAAILSVKLKYFKEYIQKRQAAATFYNQAFAHHPDIVTPTIMRYTTHVFHQYTLLVTPSKREGLIHHLQSKNIPAMIYYPVAAHQQKMFGAYHQHISLPITNELCLKVVSLPMHTELSEEQLYYITKEVLAYFQR